MKPEKYVNGFSSYRERRMIRRGFTTTQCEEVSVDAGAAIVSRLFARLKRVLFRVRAT